MRMLAIIAAITGLFAAAPVSAQTAIFDLTGGVTAHFTLPLSPTDIIIMPNGDPNVFATETTATVNGTSHPVYLNFYLAAGGGGFDISLLDAPGYYTPAGDQLFSGTLDAPTFLAGTYQLTDYFVAGLNYQLTITTNAGPANPGVPEPATWAMLIVGFGMVGATLRRRPRAVLALG